MAGNSNLFEIDFSHIWNQKGIYFSFLLAPLFIGHGWFLELPIQVQLPRDFIGTTYMVMVHSWPPENESHHAVLRFTLLLSQEEWGLWLCATITKQIKSGFRNPLLTNILLGPWQCLHLHQKKKEEVDASNTEYYEWKAFALATTSGYMF
ncbi:unnamed protein product [Lactuca saligna]|uniref:Uncharacterized protein n=1 Tax=Lactuca saligna TaxID=75948 RepID=A0AA36DXH3_LACSI|nr:unnamed protein product [Lactuca saligna]